MKNKQIIVFLLIFLCCNLSAQNFSIELKLKQPISDSLCNIVSINSLLKKYPELEIEKSWNTANNPDLLLNYIIKGNNNKTEVVNDFLKTGLFDDNIREFEEGYVLSDCSNPVSVNDSCFLIYDRWSLDLIEAPCAWSITTGDTNVLIGIVDTDFDPTQNDLLNKFKYILGPISLQNSHGTKVSTIAAANTNNLIGMASVGYNCKIAAHRFPHHFSLDSSSVLYNSVDSRTGIVALSQNGVKIINLSATNSGLSVLDAKEITEKGTTLILAAGNSSTATCHSAIADIPGVIVVSCSDVNDNHCINYPHNQWVDICAPGKNVVRGDVGNVYRTSEGTSISTPFVSGTIALMLSVNPYLPPSEIENIIKLTADTLTNAYLYPGLLGAGRLNAYKAVKAAQDTYSESLDLYIKDRHEDLGIPGGYYWQADRDNSPDMWVRNQPDGRTNQVHESPEYNPNQPVYLYVRVRNKSCVTSVGTEQLKVFWSKAAGWSSWPEKWDGTNPTEGNIIDSVYIGEILPGRDSIYEFTWNIYNTFQNGNWHQCLLARIENSAVDTIIIAPYDNLHDDVYFNNNVSWKNVVVSNLIPNTTLNSCGGYFYVGNPTNQATVQQLKLSESSLDGESGFLNEGELFLTFDSVGWQFFYPLIANNKEIKFLGQRKIQLMKDNFNITNIVYPTNTVYPIFIEYKLVSSRSSEQKSFKFDVREYLVDTNVLLLGGVHFTINKPDFDDFLAKTEKQIKVNANSQVSLSATQYSGNYDYYWYNNNDSLIGNSASITFPAPEQSAVYQLQVLSDDFCIYDYSNITIIVNQNYIVSISPNPANTNISVEYRLSNTVTVAEFIIVNQLGVVQTTQPININLNKQDIYVGRLPAGVYTIKLIVDDEISDSKTFIKG